MEEHDFRINVSSPHMPKSASCLGGTDMGESRHMVDNCFAPWSHHAASPKAFAAQVRFIFGDNIVPEDMYIFLLYERTTHGNHGCGYMQANSR